MSTLRVYNIWITILQIVGEFEKSNISLVSSIQWLVLAAANSIAKPNSGEIYRLTFRRKDSVQYGGNCFQSYRENRKSGSVVSRFSNGVVH